MQFNDTLAKVKSTCFVWTVVLNCTSFRPFVF